MLQTLARPLIFTVFCLYLVGCVNENAIVETLNQTSSLTNKLVFTTEPPSVGTSSVALSTTIVVQFQNSSGVVQTSAGNSVTLMAYSDALCLTPDTGGTLSGGSTSAISGVASFSASSVTYTGTSASIYLGASSPGSGYTNACSSQIVYQLTASKLKFITEPSSSVGLGLPLSSPPTVQVQTLASTAYTTGSYPVTLKTYLDSGCTIQYGAMTATTNPLSTVSGNAVFSNLYFYYGHPTYIYLGASSPGLTSACSTAMTYSGSWTIEDGSTNGTTIAYATAISSSGNLSVVGTTNQPVDEIPLLGVQDSLVTTYNNLGVRQWTVTNGVAGATSVATGVVVDSSGFVYVTGYTTGALPNATLHGIQDFFITKYDKTGSWVWTVQDGVLGGYTSATGISIDSLGNIYVVGNATVAIDGQTLHGNSDFFITKYNGSGVQQWTIEDGSNSNTYAMAVAVDNSGNIYVTGNTLAALDLQTLHSTNDFFITKYTSAGVFDWTVENGGSSTGSSVGNSVAVDSSSNVYVTGYTTGALDGNTLYGSQDFFITKYNSTGVHQWTVEDGVTGATVIGNSVAVDTSGDVFVTGATSLGLDGQTLHGSKDAFLTKYNSGGTLQWTLEDGASGGSMQGYGVTLDSSGKAYMTGTTTKAIDMQSLIGIEDFFISKY